MAQKWEYKIYNHRLRNTREILKELNELGNLGWELAGTRQYESGPLKTLSHEYIFKRPYFLQEQV